MEPSKQIRVALAYAELTQSQLASRLETTPQSLSQRLSKGLFTVRDMQKIAEAIGCEWEAHFVFPDGTRL